MEPSEIGATGPSWHQATDPERSKDGWPKVWENAPQRADLRNPGRGGYGPTAAGARAHDEKEHLPPNVQQAVLCTVRRRADLLSPREGLQEGQEERNGMHCVPHTYIACDKILWRVADVQVFILLFLQRNCKELLKLSGVYLTKPESLRTRPKHCFRLHLPDGFNKRRYVYHGCSYIHTIR